MSLVDEPLIYSVSRAAKAIGFGRTFTYKLVKAGRIRSIVVAGRTRVRREDLLAWIEAEAAAYENWAAAQSSTR